MSDYHLTAIQDFGDYKRGAHIEDPAEVARILGGEHAVHVVKVWADPKPSEPEAVTIASLPSPDESR